MKLGNERTSRVQVVLQRLAKLVLVDLDQRILVQVNLLLDGSLSEATGIVGAVDARHSRLVSSGLVLANTRALTHLGFLWSNKQSVAEHTIPGAHLAQLKSESLLDGSERVQRVQQLCLLLARIQTLQEVRSQEQV